MQHNGYRQGRRNANNNSSIILEDNDIHNCDIHSTRRFSCLAMCPLGAHAVQPTRSEQRGGETLIDSRRKDSHSAAADDNSRLPRWRRGVMRPYNPYASSPLSHRIA